MLLWIQIKEKPFTSFGTYAKDHPTHMSFVKVNPMS
jgi:hypothetical protein